MHENHHSDLITSVDNNKRNLYYKIHNSSKIDCRSCRKQNNWELEKLKCDLQMNDKIRAAQRSGTKPGTSEV